MCWVWLTSSPRPLLAPSSPKQASSPALAVSPQMGWHLLFPGTSEFILVCCLNSVHVAFKWFVVFYMLLNDLGTYFKCCGNYLLRFKIVLLIILNESVVCRLFIFKNHIIWYSCLCRMVSRFLKQIKNRTITWSMNPTSGCLSEGNENRITKWYQHPYICCIIIYNSQDTEKTYMSIDGWMNKENVVDLYI